MKHLFSAGLAVSLAALCSSLPVSAQAPASVGPNFLAGSGLLRWNPLSSSNWNVTQTNWLDTVGLTNTTFANGDSVQFDDLGAVSNSVNLVGALLPSALIVHSSSNYTLRGTGTLSGATGLLKLGAGTLTLGGVSNDFAGAVFISNGTLRALTASCLGSTAGATFVSGGALDVNGQSLGQEQVVVSGAGPGGTGALVNTGAVATNALYGVRLAGSATFGGTARFDLRGAGSTLDLGGFVLTKSGTNEFWGRTAAVSNGSVDVRAGVFGLASATAGADLAVQVHTGAVHTLFGDAGAYAHAIHLYGGRLVSSNSGGSVVLRGPFLFQSNSTIHVGTNASITITNSFGGPGALLLTAANAGGLLVLETAATNAGGWQITSATLQVGNSGDRGTLGTNAVLNNGLVRFQRSDTFTVFNALSGTGVLVHAGTGALRLGGALAVSGLVAVTGGGRLIFDGSASNALSIATPAGIRAFNVQGGATVHLTNNAVVNMRGVVALGAGGASNSGHVIQYSGTWVVNGNEPGAQNRAFCVGEWPNGTSTYAMVGGSLWVTNGRVYVPWQSTQGIWNIASATAVVRQLNFNSGSGGQGQLNLESGALIVGPGGINLSGGTALVNLGGARISSYANWAGGAAMRLTGTNGPTIFDTTNKITINGQLTGTGGLVKTGSGELLLTAENALTGTVTVSAGVLSLNSTSNNGRSVIGSGPLFIQSGATATTYVSSFGLLESNSPLNSVVINGGTLYSANSSQLRDVTLTAGVLEGWFSEFQPAWDITVNAASEPSLITASLTLLSNITFRVADGPASNDLHLTSTVSINHANGGWNKAGPGTLVFDGYDYSAGPIHISNGTYVLNGQITSTAELRIATGGMLTGGGNTFGPILNHGTCSPGYPIGQLVTFLNYEQTPAATLDLALGGNSAPGTDYDRLYAYGTVSLAGTLRVTLTNGFTPAYGDSFNLIYSAGLSNAFAATELPPLPATNAWQLVDDGFGSLTLFVTTNTPPPDSYDAFSNLHALAQGPEGDDDGDGVANLFEYAAGANPTNAGSAAWLRALRTNGLFALRFTRNTSATDTTFIVEGALVFTNHVHWTGFATNRNGSWGSATNVSETGGEPVSVTAVDPAPAGTNRFLRLRVTRP